MFFSLAAVSHLNLEINIKSKGGSSVETRVLSLSNPSLPSQLLQLLVEFEMCSNGVGVVPNSLAPQIKALARTDAEFAVFLPHMFAAPAQEEAAGQHIDPVAPIDEVVKLVADAAEAQATMQNEAAWNMMAHWPLLDHAVYGRRRGNQLVGFASCTTAKIIKEYLPASSSAKMVDFGIYILPSADPSSPDATAAVDSLRQVLPCKVINHTDYLSLRGRPLAISIESKQGHGTNPAKAQLQIGTWHTAQWKFLQDLVARSGGSLDGLPFLAGIIVNGHDWSFVATTREGHKTILWGDKSFGGTGSALGAYKAVWGVRRLVKWASDVFWPWYKENALRISNG